MGSSFDGRLSILEFHVLVALASGALYGYAITEAVEEESGGTLTPRAGSLYRVIARLMAWGFVGEVDPPGSEDQHPGLPRRWYALTPRGRSLLSEESRRLARAVALADAKLRPGRP